MRIARPSRAAWPTALALGLTLGVACSKDSTGPGSQINGGWSGSTSQGRPAHFMVADGDVVIAVFSFEVVGTQCTDDVLLVLGRDPGQAPYTVTSNQFVVSTSGSAGSATFGGTMSGTQASGSLTVNAVVCQGTGNFTWSAQKATGPEINITGSWLGDLFSSQNPTGTSLSAALSQSGANLSGTWAAGAGGSGTISGTITGRMGTFHLNQTTSGCTGSFDGYATLLPGFDELWFFFNGQDCQGTHSDGVGFSQRVIAAASRSAPPWPTRLATPGEW